MDARILVMDDEPEIADPVEIYLKSEGCIVFKCSTGTETLAAVRTQALDLAILNVMFPDISGSTPCGEIRKEYHFPVFTLAAETEDMNRITGFTVGTDDYITGSFNPLELMARVRAQPRRYIRYNEADKAGDYRNIIDFNGLVVNRATHECTLYDQELGLTSIEFNTLRMFCENQSQVISAERLFESVWREKYPDRDNTITVYTRRLREKIGEPSRNPWFIKTVWGVGYKID